MSGDTAGPHSAPVHTQPSSKWDAANFKKWCDMKMGSGETVYWYITGDLYEYPTGRLLAKVEGVDLARAGGC